MNIRLNIILLVLMAATSADVWSKSNFSQQKERAIKSTYIVQLKNDPVIIFNNKHKLSKSFKTSKFNSKSKVNLQYKKQLISNQISHIDLASKTIKRALTPKFKYQTALNGYAVKLTSAEAEIIAKLPEVKSINIAAQPKTHTDRGPLMINAPAAWNGTVTGLSVKGEGIVIGIIDTGIRHDHPSFAEVSPSDSYVHINPFGNNVFIGYCETVPSFCNNKLIGAYNYADGKTDPEDERSHGTHVASTAAGNTLSFDLGNGNGFNLTGVAPRANIIAYRIAGEESTSTPGASTMAIDQAVVDGVDVINYSFGGDAFNPWNATDSIAFRNARAAGIIVITSAGNDGPNAETIGSPADAPWLTSVAASTHDRGAYPQKTLSDMSGGNTSPPGTMTGRSLTGELTANIVYAGNFTNGDTNPEQCLTPFPAGTFTGEIVVCDRGEIARVQKAKNVAAGGAGGYILANVQGGASNLADDIYVIPGIQISANNGDTLKAWLASGSNHVATVNGANGPIGVNPAAADIVASFSSRGANPSVGNVLKPSVSAPGVAIFAADIGEVDYGFKQGTSMSSPHVAGAAALIKQSKPNWTAGQIHSALVTTGVTSLVKENGITSADPFDIGGGRVDLSKALTAGLLLDESVSNFIAADPSANGEPASLNLPSMASQNCSGSCSWTRQVTAVVNGAWNASFISDTGLTLSVTPNTFNLSENQSQTLTVNAQISGIDGQWLFGRLTLTPNDSSISTTQLPIAVQVNNSTLPNEATISTQRDSGQHTFSNLVSVATSSLTASAYLIAANPMPDSIELDSDNSSAFDDLTDGVNVNLINVVAGSQLVFATTSNSTAEDLDLFVGFDTNDDGQAQESELIESSTSPNADEQVLITQPQTGTYWVVVQNFSGAETGEDDYTLVAGSTLSAPSTDIVLNLPSSSNGVSPFDIDVNFDNISNQQYFSALALSTGSSVGDLGVMGIVVNRLADDVSISASPGNVSVGDNVSVTVSVSPNENGVRNYIMSMGVPSGLTVDANSLTNGASLNNNQITWDVSVNGNATNFSFNAQATASLASQTVNLSIDHNVDLPNAKQATSSTSFSVQSQSNGGGGTNDSSNSSSGGGSIFYWNILLAFLLTCSIRKQKRSLS